MSILIVSDYDGTLKRNDDKIELQKNINALKTLLIEDVRIMISTGRLYKSIRSEIDNFIIPFNYLSCANGNVLFDEKFNILYKTIANSEILKILKPYYKNIFSLEMLDEYGMRTNKEPVEILIKIEEEKNIRRQIVDQLLLSPNVDYCTDGNNKYTIHIFSLSNKTKTIDFLKNRKRITTDKIYTIGDGSNDLDMIKEYNGFIIGKQFDKSEDLNAIPKYETFDACIKELQNTLKRSMKK